VYDAYNRIQKVTEGTSYRDFAYKEPGNLSVAAWSGTGWAPASFTPASSAWFDSNNRMVNALLGIQYDAAGHLTAIGGFTFGYDAEGRMVSSTLNGTTVTYAYDGEGRRVKKGSVVMVYDAFGRLAGEYGGTVEPLEYFTVDHLGSTRLVTSAAGAERQCLDYLPFGEQMVQGMGARGACYANANEPRVKFTGKERDAETGLDWFEARYMSSAQGRFSSPDPENAGALVRDPQSWNMYAYGRNNPLRYTDPGGLSYRVCRTGENGKETNCTTQKNELSDKQFEQFRKGNKGTQIFAVGKVYGVNEDGSRGAQTGTYKQTDVDIDNPAFGAVVQGVQAASPVADARFVAGFYGASALGGLALYGGGAFAGGELTTLGIGTGTASEGSTALTSTLQLSKHAAERMAERGFTRDMFRATIKNGSRYWDPKNGTFNCSGSA
jgi:RHS repeat-associated protein